MHMMYGLKCNDVDWEIFVSANFALDLFACSSFAIWLSVKIFVYKNLQVVFTHIHAHVYS